MPSHAVPSSPTSFHAVPDRLQGPRDLAALHRDVLALLRQYPLVFVGLPALVFFPLDLLNELVSRAAGGDDPLQELQVYVRVSRWIELGAGTFVAASVLEGLRIASRGEAPTFGAVWRGGGRTWGRALKTTFITGFIVGLGTLLFIVPGLILGTRYMLAVPASVLDGLESGRARERSSELVVQRGALRLFAWAFAAAVSWYVLAMVPSLVATATPFVATDGMASALLMTIAGASVNVVAAALVVAAGMLYLELSGQAAVWPVGGELVGPDGRRVPPPATSGHRQLAAVGVSAGLALVILLPLWSIALWFAFEPEGAAAFLEQHPALERAAIAVFGGDEGAEPAP